MYTICSTYNVVFVVNILKKKEAVDDQIVDGNIFITMDRTFLHYVAVTI